MSDTNRSKDGAAGRSSGSAKPAADKSTGVGEGRSATPKPEKREKDEKGAKSDKKEVEGLATRLPRRIGCSGYYVDFTLKRFCGVVIAIIVVLIAWVANWTQDIMKWREIKMNEDIVCPAGALHMSTTEHITDFEPLGWDESYAKAETLLAQMTAEEKYKLMQGRGWVLSEPKRWWYTGNTEPVARLGIPTMNMQDAAGGFRTMWSEITGTVTCWPSALAMAATWDPEAVRELSGAMADEFAGKGANMVLGPSVQVHRVTRNGRNFEYISGEDPYLGSKLIKAYVEGFNSRGVMTSAKHWGFNEQETNRNWGNSIVPLRAAWELYYPAFEAAIDAGITTVMCGYNRIDGTWSCGNQRQLNDILRGALGFRGFVQSDWWATHGNDVENGLDQEMPGNYLGDGTMSSLKDIMTKEHSPHYDFASLRRVPKHLIDESAKRILASLYRMGQIDKQVCAPPCCERLFVRNVTSAKHEAIARKVATESIVLLKNRGNVLPISATKVKSIAVIGSAAVGKSFDPLGSSQTQDEGFTGQWNQGDYYSGGGSGHVASGNTVTPLAGIQRRAAKAGINVVSSVTNDHQKAVKAAQEADIAIIVCATTCGEGVDRPHLWLDHFCNEMIAEVLKEGKPTVVIMQVPGAMHLPWHDKVDAAALMFLGGQETGNAWAAVLFGDVPPSGKLPLMIPATHNKDVIEPGHGEHVVYAEGMKTSYRNPDFQAAFPFGHGLTYTTFEYGKLETCTPRAGADLCLQLDVSNTGKVSARTVAQLYIEYPEMVYPGVKPLLKGYQKTSKIEPGAKATVTFHLTPRDISFTECNHLGCQWTKTISLVAHVGESSADIRDSLPLFQDAEQKSWGPPPSSKAGDSQDAASSKAGDGQDAEQ